MEEIEVEVLGIDDAPETPVSQGSGWRRWVVPACAVVLALCALTVAVSQLRLSRAAERSNCLLEAQVLSFGPNQGTRDQYLERLRGCGVDVSDDTQDDDEG